MSFIKKNTIFAAIINSIYTINRKPIAYIYSRAYIKGDNNAFDLLLSRNQQRLYSYILFVVHDSEMAEDVFQDTFVKVIMRLQSGQYTSCGKFSAWIMRIAHNVIMDYYRDQRIESVVSTVDNEDLSQIDGRHVIVPNVESRYVNEQVYSDVRRMMNLLPPSQREVIFMRFFQEMSFKEIAEATSVSINTALGRMRYAVLNLRRMAKSNGITLQLD